jgi:hypothetical protein
MVDRLLPGQIEKPPEWDGAAARACVLVLGEGRTSVLQEAQALGGPLEMAAIPALDAGLLARLRPEWIVFPLIEGRYDAPQVIETLAALGYAGRACVIAPPLPNRRMVEVELRAICPALNLLLVEASG